MPERWFRAISLVTFAIVAAVLLIAVLFIGPLDLLGEGSYIWIVFVFPAWRILKFVVTRLVLVSEQLAASRRNPSGFTFRYLKPKASRITEDGESGQHAA
jgi:hypothetical protein